VIKDLTEEKIELEKQYKQKLEQQTVSMDQYNQNVLNNLKEQVSELETNNSKLSKEIIELNDIISAKNLQLAAYQRQEEEKQTQKANSLLKELQLKSQIAQDSADISKKFMESDQQNQILILKKDLEQALEKIKYFEKENLSLK
jgi:hypothetical protein